MSSEGAQARVAENPAWYHTLEVAPGVVTARYVDWREKVARTLPDDLWGKHCLDIGIYDGFWAFAMEARGGEVVAIDVDTLESGAYVQTCGFENVRRGRLHRPPSTPEMRTWYADLEARAPS